MDPIDERTLRLFIENSVAVMTTNPQARDAWRSDLTVARSKALEAGADDQAVFFEALAGLIDGDEPVVPRGNPYASAVQSVIAGVDAANSASGTISAVDLRTIIVNTVAVKTTAAAQLDMWRGQIEQELITAQGQGAAWRAEVDLYGALLALLDDKATSLAPGHPYVGVLRQIALGVAQAAPPAGLTEEQLESTIENTLAALLQPEDLADWRDQVQAWHETALGHGLHEDADWFALLLGTLDGQAGELPDTHRYSETARLFEARLLAQMSDGSDLAMDQVLDVVRAFVAAADWDQTEAVFSDNQATLLSPEADQALQILLGQAQEGDDEATVEVLGLHRDILNVIKREGPRATFDWIRAQDDLDD